MVTRALPSDGAGKYTCTFTENGKAPKEADGTLIEFQPDPEVFKQIDFRPEHVERRLRHPDSRSGR